ncbi:MAG: reverse transcriptase/maturase family protein [Bacteroidales bacterium]|nr:reverse transcriptase/maturase family protein [Bacteroidales bacterium]
MKRVNNIFDQIASKDNLQLAHKNASRGKSRYREVKDFNVNPAKYTDQLHDSLISKTFVNSKYEIFERNCSGKLRIIYKLPYYPDRIVHHAILQVLEPIWKSVFIRDTYQSIKGRGVHAAKKRIDEAIHKYKPQYCLKFDVHKFYPSVDNVILKDIIRRKIKCKDTLWLLDGIINSVDGLPIGNYISQYLGNLYLAYFDHYFKNKYNLKYYYRYCDDVVILNNDKGLLHEILNDIKGYLHNELNLQLKPNYQIFPLKSRAIDFLGYQFHPTHTLVRNSIKRNFIRKARNFNQNKSKSTQRSLTSLYGWIKHCDGHNLLTKYLNDYESIIRGHTTAI